MTIIISDHNIIELNRENNDEFLLEIQNNAIHNEIIDSIIQEIIDEEENSENTTFNLNGNNMDISINFKLFCEFLLTILSLFLFIGFIFWISEGA